MPTVSQKAIDLIVFYEVTDAATYTRRYTAPTWPGGASGVTIGIGYDIGYVTKAAFAADWAARIPAAMFALLAHAVGVSGPAAHALAGEMRASVAIDWPTANAVFAERTLPAYAADTARALSNCDALSGDSFGALVSLVYNRGAGFTKIGDRYTEMRAIKSHMTAKAFTAVPGDIVAMQRLWPAVPGLQKRRRDEAALFRSGLD